MSNELLRHVGTLEPTQPSFVEPVFFLLAANHPGILFPSVGENFQVL